MLSACSAAIIMAIGIPAAFAAEMPPMAVLQSSGSSIAPYADVIVYKTRKISRAYGHVAFSKPTNPTINVSFSGKFDISFSAALATTQIDTLDNDRIIRINSNGSVVDA